MFRIRGEKVTLRPLASDELDLLVHHYRRAIPPGVRAAGREEIRRRIRRSGRMTGGRLELGIEAAGRLVGDVDARSPAAAFPPGVFEIGVTVFEEEDRRQGYGLEATRLLVDHLFDAEGAARVQASTSLGNAPMRALLARLGFREEGVLRSYFPAEDGREDYVLCALTRREWLEGGSGAESG